MTISPPPPRDNIGPADLYAILCHFHGGLGDIEHEAVITDLASYRRLAGRHGAAPGRQGERVSKSKVTAPARGIPPCSPARGNSGAGWQQAGPGFSGRVM